MSIGDEELEAAVVNGFEGVIQKYRAEYEEFAEENLIPIWKNAIRVGAQSIDSDNAFEFDSDSDDIRKWLDSCSRSFVNAAVSNLDRSIANTLQKCRKRGFNSTQTAYAIRPMIGLYPRQATANWRFQRTFIKYLRAPSARNIKSLRLKNPISDEIRALQEKLEGALDYSLEQIKERAKQLAESGLVGAFNKGLYELVRQLMERELMGLHEKVWVTAQDPKVCDVCIMLSGKTVGFYEAFYDHTGKFIGQFPPAHPHCRCTIFYREILPPGLDDLTPEAMTSPNTPPYCHKSDFAIELQT